MVQLEQLKRIPKTRPTVSNDFETQIEEAVAYIRQHWDRTPRFGIILGTGAGKLAEKIAKAREEARNELISRLNPSQQTEVKEMIGDAFSFPEPEKRSNEKFKKGKGKRKTFKK